MGLDAFDEFDEIDLSGAEPEPQAAVGPAPVDPAGGNPNPEPSAAVDALDEDLFDFPRPDLSHVEPVPTTAQSHPAPATPEPAAVATATTPAPEPAPAPAPAQAPAQAPAPAPAPAPVLPSVGARASGAPMAESDLDDDLFQFPDVFSGALLATPPEDATHVSVQSDIFTVDDPSPEPVSEIPQVSAQAASAPEPQFAPEPATLEPQSAPVPAAAAPVPEPVATSPRAPQSAGQGPAQPGFDPTPKYQGYQPYVPPTDEELVAMAVPAPGRSHLTEILAAAFLVLNVALVLFAYQANASFHDTLTEVSRSVAQTLTNNQASAQERPPSIVFPLPPQTEDPANQLPNQALDLRLQSMALARRMVEEERYFDARRVLYRLLANRDLAALDPSFVAEAEFMVAESYELQGKALAEVQR